MTTEEREYYRLRTFLIDNGWEEKESLWYNSEDDSGELFTMQQALDLIGEYLLID